LASGRTTRELEPSSHSALTRSAGGGGGAIPAKDALGNDIKKSEYLKTHQKGDR